MTTLETIFLALIQGLTEFLPISSSAHLIIPSEVLGWKDQGLAFDVAVHVGTLFAVLIYFRDDLSRMLFSWVGSFKGEHTSDSRLAWFVLLGTIPAASIGFFAKDFIEVYLRSGWVIAAATIAFGLLLGWADNRAQQQRVVEHLTLKDVMFIGFAQAIAIIPGTSRSGITMTAGLMLGLDRQSAARFSFLLSIPIIALAGGYLTLKLALSDESVAWGMIGLGTLVAFVSAYACIHYFLMFVEKVGMMPFVIYRLVLGAGLIFFLI